MKVNEDSQLMEEYGVSHIDTFQIWTMFTVVEYHGSGGILFP